MKRSFLIIILVLMVCFAVSCQQQEEKPAEPMGLSTEDIAANKAIVDAFAQGAMSNDWPAVAALYTDDAIVMPANEPMVQGKEAILEWQQLYPTIKEFALTAEEVFGNGDVAVVRGTYSMTLEIEGIPEPIQDTGKFIEIRRKQADGSWLISVDIFNSDLPAPTM
jgi:ketosteroid isomerase-like protein